MKKNLFICLSLIFILSTFCLCACDTNSIYNYAASNIAECRQSMYVGFNENVKATFITGKREKDYVVNGFCTEPIDFGVLTFEVVKEVKMPDVVNYVLTIGTTRYDGILELNPYNGTYVCDIRKLVGSNENITAKIIAGDFVENITLNDITSNWNVNYDNALRLACNELKSKLKSFVEDDTFKAECYIKIVNDDEIDDVYYWYINFVGRDGKSYALIIDPVNNEVLAQK